MRITGYLRRFIELTTDPANDLGTSLGAEGDSSSATGSAFAQINDVQTRVGDLETTVDTTSTGLVDKVTALETTIDTADTGLIARVEDLETTVDTAATGLTDRVEDLEGLVGDGLFTYTITCVDPQQTDQLVMSAYVEGGGGADMGLTFSAAGASGGSNTASALLVKDFYNALAAAPASDFPDLVATSEGAVVTLKCPYWVYSNSRVGTGLAFAYVQNSAGNLTEKIQAVAVDTERDDAAIAALRVITGDGTMQSTVECKTVTAGCTLSVLVEQDSFTLTAVESGASAAAGTFNIGTNRECSESLLAAINYLTGVTATLPASPSAKITAGASTLFAMFPDDPAKLEVENCSNMYPNENLMDYMALSSFNSDVAIGLRDDTPSTDVSTAGLFGLAAGIIASVSDTATVTIDAAVDTNSLTLNGVAETFGVGGIGAAVVAGTAPENDHANALLMAEALIAHEDVQSAEAVLGVVTVTAKPGRILLFTSVTATRIVVADTSSNYSVAKQLRTLIEAV